MGCGASTGKKYEEKKEDKPPLANSRTASFEAPYIPAPDKPALAKSRTASEEAPYTPAPNTPAPVAPGAKASADLAPVAEAVSSAEAVPAEGTAVKTEEESTPPPVAPATAASAEAAPAAEAVSSAEAASGTEAVGSAAAAAPQAEEQNSKKTSQEPSLDQFTEEQIAEFKLAFDDYDQSGRGVITKKELESAMRSKGQNPTEEELQEMFRLAGVDITDAMDFPHFCFMMAAKMEGENASAEDDLKEAFKACDKDGTGFLSPEEMKEVMRQLGEIYTSDEEVEAMLAQVDTNGDGKIDYAEFVNAMTGE